MALIADDATAPAGEVGIASLMPDVGRADLSDDSILAPISSTEVTLPPQDAALVLPATDLVEPAAIISSIDDFLTDQRRHACVTPP